MLSNNSFAFVSLWQVPQFILDHMLDAGRPGKVVVTQPRRLAAVSVATRVSQERGERLGESVGYHVRLDARLPSFPASVVFCTTGILLRQLSGSRGLDGVVHVVVDEVWEWGNVLPHDRMCFRQCVSVHVIGICFITSLCISVASLCSPCVQAQAHVRNAIFLIPYLFTLTELHRCTSVI